MPNTNATNLPRPNIVVYPAKAGLPERGGNVDLLVTLSVSHPKAEVDRKPLSLALVIDRSGSMSGPPLAAAKQAAKTAVSMLILGDWVSVVAFDDKVTVAQQVIKVAADVRPILTAIEAIASGGSTNLFGGWAEGLSQVMACPEKDVIGRVVLLSDGLANQGVTDSSAIGADVAQAAGLGVTTTTMGLGGHYDEDLLRSMADSGRGNYVFLEGEQVVVQAFEHELAGLSSLRGRNVHLTAAPKGHAHLTHTRELVAETAGLGADADGLKLRDLMAGLPADYLVTLHLEAGRSDVRLELHWDDAVTGGQDKECVTLDFPWLSAEEWLAAPTDRRVADTRTLLDVAAQKRTFSEAARRGDDVTARAVLDHIAKLLGTLPAGEERGREEAELMELRRQLEARDHAMAARFSERGARRQFSGQTEAKYRAMAAAERTLRQEKLDLRVARATGMETTVPDPAAAGELLLDQQHARPGGSVTVQVVRGRIQDQAVNAIVNSTSRGLIGASGVDGAITRAGGPQLVAAMRSTGGMGYGEAVFTPGFELPAKFVIHTAAQPWEGGGVELDVLERCYGAVFGLAHRLGVSSIALPAIGTGNYGFPVEVAVEVAARVARDWALNTGSLDLVRFVAFDRSVGAAYVAVLERW